MLIGDLDVGKDRNIAIGYTTTPFFGAMTMTTGKPTSIECFLMIGVSRVGVNRFLNHDFLIF